MHHDFFGGLIYTHCEAAIMRRQNYSDKIDAIEKWQKNKQTEGNAMFKRWTPRRVAIMRRIRVVSAVLLTFVLFAATFFIGVRKTVALEINGEKSTVTTFAMTAEALLAERHVDVKTHDFIDSSSGSRLENNAVVIFKTAYQTAISINGVEVPFWTYATDATQILNFFDSARENSIDVSLKVNNIYDKLSGSFAINENGPVTVICDGKISEAPDGKLPAASILDQQGITLDKEDRVSVEKNSDKPILRVSRVKHEQQTQTVPIPYTTQTIIDPNLEEGKSEVRLNGRNGEKIQIFDVTLVDGVEESRKVVNETIAKDPVVEIVAKGGKKPDSLSDSDSDNSSKKQDSQNPQSDNSQSDNNSSTNPAPSADPTATPTPEPQDDPTVDPSPSPTVNPQPEPSPAPTVDPTPEPEPEPEPSPEPSQDQWHATPLEAQVYAQAVAAQRGWTGSNWEAILFLWEHESNWRWNAENPYSGAYGIPQALPGNKMGAGWHDNAAVQIQWGMSYFSSRYGTPTEALRHWKEHNWY